MPKGQDNSAELATLPREARPIVAAASSGKTKPVYLVYGEPMLVGLVSHALVDALVPAERRSMNLEVYDGRATALMSILDSARMPGFFGGTKLVWVRELPLLQAGEKRSDVVAVMLDAIQEGRMESASGRCLGLLASAGWSQAEFDDNRISEMSATKITQAFGEIDAAALGALDELQAWMRGRGMKVAAGADASEELVSVIEKGLPPNVVLLLTASSVDSRKRVVKRIKELGAVLELGIERERSGTLAAESAATIIDRILAAHRKSLAAAARARLMRRVGGDPAALANEVEKLCLYAGDKREIGPAEVDDVVRDMADAWIFDFTDALGSRDLRKAWPVLRGLLDAGDHPLRLLATLHSQVRLLLLLRGCLDGAWRGRWRPGTRADAMTGLIELLPKEEAAAIGKMHPYRLALTTGYASKFSTAALRRALRRLAELDTKFKSSRGDPGLLLEAFVMEMCGT